MSEASIAGFEPEIVPETVIFEATSAVEIAPLPEENPDDHYKWYGRFQWLTRRMARASLKVSAPLLALGVGTFHLQNTELLQTLYEHVAYERPEPGDIVPERIDCDLDRPSRYYEARDHELNLEVVPNDVEYIPEADPGYRSAYAATSRALGFGNASTAGYAASEHIFWPGNNYFDTGTYDYTTEIGLEMNFFMHHGDVPYVIDPNAIDKMIDDIFEHTELYTNPNIRRIVECMRRPIIEQRRLEGHEADVNVIANGDKRFEGNNVVTLLPEKTDSLSGDMGISDISLEFLWMHLTPDHAMLIAGGNDELEVNVRRLNKRFLHALFHVLFFQDLSDTRAEIEEQERFVRYGTNVFMAYYDKHGNLPLVITVP
jgi:hypothetical protein